jgi:hypothetical protein
MLPAVAHPFADRLAVRFQALQQRPEPEGMVHDDRMTQFVQKDAADGIAI